jgi:hypothetical protein
MSDESAVSAEGPEIRTTELGKRLFQDRLAEMRRVKPDIGEPRWVIIPEKNPDGSEVRHPRPA